MCLCSDHDCTAGAWTPAELVLAWGSGSGMRWAWGSPGVCVGFAEVCWVLCGDSGIQPVLSRCFSPHMAPSPSLQTRRSSGRRKRGLSQKHRLCCFFSRLISFPFVSVPCTSLTEPYFCKVGGRIWSFHGSGKSVHGLGEYKCCLSSSSDI